MEHQPQHSLEGCKRATYQPCAFAVRQVKKMAEHDNFVNSCGVLRRGPPLIVSGSDDGTAKARGSCCASKHRMKPSGACTWSVHALHLRFALDSDVGV